MAKKKYTCPDCGGDQILVRAHASWDTGRQQWILADYDDESWTCMTCGQQDEKLTEECIEPARKTLFITLKIPVTVDADAPDLIVAEEVAQDIYKEINPLYEVGNIDTVDVTTKKEE